MKCSIIKQTIVLTFLFSSTLTYGQGTYTNSIQESATTLEEKAIGGYVTDFDFSREQLRRGWWEYSRKFGSPINMKTYYKVKIPSDYTDGDVDLLIYTKTEAADQGVTFFLGVAETEFREQAKNLLIDFKRDFYIKSLIRKVESKQKEAIQLSESYHANPVFDERTKILSRLLEMEKSIETLKEEIKEIVLN